MGNCLQYHIELTNKFMIDPNGKLLAHFKSGVKPLSQDITSILSK